MGGIVADRFCIAVDFRPDVSFVALYDNGHSPGCCRAPVWLEAAVVAIVAEAVLRIAKKALKNWFFVTMAVHPLSQFIYFSAFPIIVFERRPWFAGKQIGPSFSAVQPQRRLMRHAYRGLAAQVRETGWRHAFSTAAIWLTVWVVPIIAYIYGKAIAFSVASEHFSARLP